MDIKNGFLSPLQLIGLGFKTANKAFGSVLALVLFIALLSGLAIGVVALAGFLFGPTATVILAVPVYILIYFFNFVLMTAVAQLLAAKLEKRGLTMTESFSGSLRPAFYFVLSTLILLIPSALLSFGASLSGSSTVVFLVTLGVVLLQLPFMFTLYAAALRDEGPIGALRYSWDLTTRYWWRILLAVLVWIGLVVCLVLAAACLVKALLSPEVSALFFSGDSAMAAQMLPFMLMGWLAGISKPMIIAIAVIFMALNGFIMLSIQATFVALFLNLDYHNSPISGREINLTGELTDQNGQLAEDILSEVEVKQAAIRTHTDEDTTRHLDQVYQAQEHLANAIDQEEDRMPTILFDEDMAQRLAENERQMQERKQRAEQQKGDEGQQSIKMSDKPL